MSSKKTRGKQKIAIKRIEKDEDRLVTLTKRRNGIFGKLSELSILCGADVAFLVHSAAGKPYTFGSPSFDSVAKRFLNGGGGSSSSSSSILDAHRKMKIDDLCKLYNSTVEKIEAAEEEGEILAATSSLPAVKKDAWWKVEPEEVEDNEEAKQLMRKHEELYERLYEEIARRSHGGGGASSSSFAWKNRHN